MKQAIERAGSIFTGWISSCLFCLGPRDDDESAHHQQAMNQRGAEREMRICHTQPHLVPPMKVVYNDLPSPRPLPRASTLPSWVVEGRNRASRASNRASMSLKRKSTAPVRISGPSDFRRVSMFPTTELDGFHPLELGFTSPRNRLPELPRFEEYQLEGDPSRDRAPLTRPPRALSTAENNNGRISHPRTQHRPSSSFQLVRKPVGSGSRRSSLATLEQLLERQAQTQPTPMASPLIPHFSTRSAALTASLASPTSPKPDLTKSQVRNEVPRGGPNSHNTTTTTTTTIPAVPRTPTRPNPPSLQDRPFPSIPPEDSPSSGSTSTSHPPTTPSESRPPTTPSDNPNRTPSRSGRVTQWLFQTTTPSTTTSNSNSNTNTTTQPVPTTDKNNPFRIRSRTLSGSTLASSITNLTGGGHPRTTPSLASATIMRASSHPDAQDFDLPLASPFLPKQTFPAVTEEPSYPTIYEGGEPQQLQDHEDYEDLRSQYYENYRHSAVGLAF
ncbi:hypothetical protein BO71DRAFT_450241 [Aspergillus ellipticus CBS 707.79]|uniref:Uncharacterized protein n=1 Tax=Aspergillus ellipticus CBS 707.79 TaxID=1448320 RepID=A0A319DJF5_9EURO|nr:hypothetical protein BO71DRAFT_450241 [Aspergillus ellipticus CBS 707.79]